MFLCVLLFTLGHINRYWCIIIHLMKILMHVFTPITSASLHSKEDFLTFAWQNIHSLNIYSIFWGRKCYFLTSSTWHLQTYSESKVPLMLNENRVVNNIIIFSISFLLRSESKVGSFRFPKYPEVFFLIKLLKFVCRNIWDTSVFLQSQATKSTNATML